MTGAQEGGRRALAQAVPDVQLHERDAVELAAVVIVVAGDAASCAAATIAALTGCGS